MFIVLIAENYNLKFENPKVYMRFYGEAIHAKNVDAKWISLVKKDSKSPKSDNTFSTK